MAKAEKFEPLVNATIQPKIKIKTKMEELKYLFCKIIMNSNYKVF